jgi:hypothetical protein
MTGSDVLELFPTVQASHSQKYIIMANRKGGSPKIALDWLDRNNGGIRF